MVVFGSHRSALVLTCGLVACSEREAASGTQAVDSQAAEVAEVEGSETNAPVDTCPACRDNADCEDALCIQAGLESYCAPICMRAGDRDTCDAGRICTLTATYAGGQATVCLPTSGPCAAAPITDPPGEDTCGTLVGPDVTANCYACRVADEPCQANGCYGGWWCNTSSNHCQSPPSACAGDVKFTGGAAVAGTVDANGGPLSRLYFAVVGDTRPPLLDDTAGYPTHIITPLYEDPERITHPTPHARRSPSPPATTTSRSNSAPSRRLNSTTISARARAFRAPSSRRSATTSAAATRARIAARAWPTARRRTTSSSLPRCWHLSGKR